jgi:Tol biopolymer transport system component/DNA-binding winged helix-turn-helix (wHTH) protein
MPTNGILRFGVFEADLHAGELRRAGLKVKLSGQPFEVLVTLLEKPGQVVTREELHQKLWAQDTFVDFEHGLNKAINKVREALGDDADNPRFIETLPRRGYRFLALTAPAPQEAPAVGSVPEPQLPLPSAPPGSGMSRWNVNRRKLWAAGLVGFCVAFASFYWFTHRSPVRAPAVLRYRVLTSDRRMKNANPCGAMNVLVTDGPRVFFSEPSSPVSQVSSVGGDVVGVPIPFQCFMFSDISPDKTELVGGAISSGYAADLPLWSLSIASGQAHRLGNLTAHSAAWSPDGQRIAYAVTDADTNANDLYVAAKDGSAARKLARLENASVGLIRWSPDGKVLRMVVQHESSGSVWEVTTDGTNLHAMDLFLGQHRQIMDMNWTPDGKYFLFTVGRGNTFSPFVALGGDIWAVAEAKSLSPRKTAVPIQLTTGAMSFWSPTPSPDGKRVFATGGQTRGELARYDLKSRKLEPFLSGISAEQLDFSKDGKWVTYTTFPGGILWRSRVDGSERRQLTNPPLTAGLPRWSPDGTRIAFSGLLPGQPWKIYVVSAEGGTPEVVSQEEGAELDPTWSEGGNSLIYGNMMFSAKVRISSVDLRTGRESMIPGSEGMFSPRVSPDNRFIVAMDAPGNSKMLLFDRETQKWTELMNNKKPGLSWEQWSGDSRSVYVADFTDRHAPSVYRIRIPDGKTERVAAFEVPEGITGYWVGWMGVDPNGNPLVLRDLSIQEIYALDVDFP